MKLKKLLSGFLAAAMAVTTMVTATLSASAAETTNVVVYEGDLSAWGGTTVDISSKGTPASGATVTVEFDEAEYDEANNNIAFKICDSSWAAQYTEDKTEAGGGSHTFQISELPGTSFVLQAGHLANHFKVTVSEIEAPPFEGESFALTKNGDYNWQARDMFSSSVSASTLADLMKKVDGVEISFTVNGAVSGTNQDFDLSLLSYQIQIDASGSGNYYPWIVGGSGTYDSTTKKVKVTFSGIAEEITKVMTKDGASASEVNFDGFKLVAMCDMENATEEIRVYHESYTVNVTAPVAKHTITIATGIENGSVTSDKTTAAKDEKVTLTVTPDEGYELEGVIVATSTAGTDTVTVAADNTFTMPDDDVTVTATFKEIPAPGALTISKSELTIADWKTTATTTLTASVAGDPDATITWETSDATVATVANGVVTFKKRGIVTITAKSGEQSKKCTITVNERETATAQKPLPTETKADGTKVRNEVLVITAAQAASAKSVTIKVTDRNTGKFTEKTVTECYKTVKYTAGDKTTDTISGGSNYLIAVTVTGIPAGVDPADVVVTFVVNEA